MGEISRKHIPMFRYAIFLIVGIVVAQYIALPVWLAASVGVLALMYILYQFFYPTKHYQLHLFVIISIVVLCLGCMRQQFWLNRKSPTYKQLRISSFPQKQSFQIQFEATITNSADFVDAETFLVVCKDTSITLKYGDVFSTAATEKEIPAPNFPFEFDYKTYLFSNGITHKLELCTVTIQTDTRISTRFFQWIQYSREQFKKTTALIFKTPASKGLAESLLLGYREELDRETKDSFLKSGVSHLLAVSGMHTALIYEAIFLLFIPFGSSQKHRFVFLATALFVLTYFTLLSGCSASVLRASIMCSMFAIAYTFRKRGSGINTLGISIVVILWFTPYQVWNLGFQLSALAVIGILTLHQYLSKQFTFKYKISTYLFEALSITVCAQITTLPVILYHFKSFPIYFIPANLVLIPISTIALFTSMASIFFVGLGISFEWLFNINQWLIELFSSCAALFARLPNSSIQPIHFTALEAWVIVGIVCVYIQHPFKLNKKTIVLSCIVCLAWTGYRIKNEYEAQHKEEILFISNGKKSAFLSINGLDASIYTQIPMKNFNQSSMKGYFNLRCLTEICVPSTHAGIIASIPKNTAMWLYKKSCTSPKEDMEHLFSYKEKDSTSYHPNYFHSLKTKKMIYFKMK